MHGFSQALRRELVDTNIGITYVPPRTILTAMNDQNTIDMMNEAGQKMDKPEVVAGIIINALVK